MRILQYANILLRQTVEYILYEPTVLMYNTCATNPDFFTICGTYIILFPFCLIFIPLKS